MNVTQEQIAEQLTMEANMVELGRERYIAKVKKSLERGEMSSTPAGNRVVAGGVERVATYVEGWLTEQATKQKESTQNRAVGKRGGGCRFPTIYKLVLEMDPMVLSTIALRSIVNGCHKRVSYQRAAIQIGQGVEDEIRMKSFKGKAKGLYHWALAQANKQGSKAKKRTVMIWSSGRVLEMESWDEAFKLRIGALMIELIKKATGIIKVVTAPGSSKDSTWYVIPTHGLLTWLRTYDQNAQVGSPMFQPMIIPPLPWSNPFDGGYYHKDMMPVIPLVKVRSKRYLDDLAQMNPVQVYKAVNALQEVAWEVNPGVLKVVQAMWIKGGEAGLPDRRAVILPSKPHDIATNKEARRNYRRVAAAVHDKTRNILSKISLTQTIIDTADRLKGRSIWFPYQTDFRGRVYAIPTGLTPQGCDLSKGMLRFAEGKPLSSPEAVRWWMIHGANCFGVDKVSFADRVAWVKENHQKILDSGMDPLTHRWWADVDSPICFLAWCIEYAQWHNDKSILSHIPIALDGSCSGLQHFSAMMRDEVGAAAVNLLPSPVPQDVYGRVAGRTTDSLQGDINNQEVYVPSKTVIVNPKFSRQCISTLARLWLEYGVDRKLCKRPVMTVPYGSTQYSCRDFIWDVVLEREAATGKPNPFGDGLTDAIIYLSGHIWKAIEDVVLCAPKVMAWLRTAATEASRSGLAVSWVAPSGFPVRQSYTETISQVVKLGVGGTQNLITISRETTDLNRRAMANGISPNFVHSMDASALVFAVNLAVDRNIKNLAVVHDSFGTHAEDTEVFAKLIRQSFVKMYEENDVLEQFKQSLGAMGVVLEAPPERGTLDIRQTLGAIYSFA